MKSRREQIQYDETTPNNLPYVVEDYSNHHDKNSCNAEVDDVISMSVHDEMAMRIHVKYIPEKGRQWNCQRL